MYLWNEGGRRSQAEDCAGREEENEWWEKRFACGHASRSVGGMARQAEAAWRAGQARPLQGKSERSGAEEDGFALEGLDGDEDGDRRIYAGGSEDDGNGIPVVGTGDDFFAD